MKMSLGVTRIGPSVPRPRAGELGVLVGAGAREVLVDVAQEDREADAHHHHRDQAGAAVPQWSPQGPVVDPAERRGRDGRHDDGDGDRHVGAADGDRARQRVDPVGDQRPEGDQLTVREVGEARRTEDHGEAESGHRQQQREDEPSDRELEALGELARLGCRGVADREGDVDVGGQLRGDLQRHLLGVAESRTLRQGLLVEVDRVGVAEHVDRLAEGDVEDAAGVAGALADRLALVVLDGELHVRDGLRRLLAKVGQTPLDVDGVVVAWGRLLAGGLTGVRHRGRVGGTAGHRQHRGDQADQQCADASRAGVHGAPVAVVSPVCLRCDAGL